MTIRLFCVVTLQWRHNGHDSASNHQPHYCLLNRLFRRRWKKTSKLRVTGLCVENSPGTGEFPAQMASNAENVSIWWRHHECHYCWYPDDTRSHGIISHVIELVLSEYFAFSTRATRQSMLIQANLALVTYSFGKRIVPWTRAGSRMKTKKL